MIAKANTHNSGIRLAVYLLQKRDGQTAELWQLRGFASTDIKDAFRDIDIMADGTRCTQPFFHAQIRLNPEEGLTREEWERVADRLEQTLNFTGQPRAIVFHKYDDTLDTHMHVAWSRIDQENLKAKPVPFFKLALKEVTHDLEQELGITQIRKEREGPIRYAPTKSEDEQARRLGVVVEDIRNTIRQCWTASTTGKEFDDELARYGLILARGDRAPFVVLDPMGGVHSIGQRILDIPAARIQQHLSDLHDAPIPTIGEARGLILDIPQNRMERLERELADTNKDIASALDGLFNAIEQKPSERQDRIDEEARLEAEWEKTKWRRQAEIEQDSRRANRSSPELRKADGEIRLSYVLTNTGQEFADALEDRGFILAKLTEKDAEHLNRWERQRVSEIWQPPEEKKDVWMAQVGGLAHLSAKHLDQANRSYQKYLAKKMAPEDREPGEKPRRPLSFEKYVSFVQEHYDASAHKYERYREGELVVIDQFSGVHQLTYKNTGDSFEEREKHFQDIDTSPLIGVSAADAAMQQFRSHRYAEWQQERAAGKEPPKEGTRAAAIRAIYEASENGQQFEDAIERKGYILASVSEADANRLNRWERARQKEDAALRGEQFDTTKPTERYKAGELVIIDNWGNIGQLTDRSTGDSEKWRDQRLSDINRASLISVSSAQSTMQMLRQHQRDEREHDWQQKRAERQNAFNETIWPAKPPQPDRQSPSMFGQAAAQAGADARATGAQGMTAKLWEIWTEIDPEIAAKAWQKANETGANSIKHDAQGFAKALEDRGISFAIATKQEASESHRRAAFAREAGNYIPRFKEGEIVVVTEKGIEFRRDGQIVESSRVRKIDQSLAEKFVAATGGRDKLHSIDGAIALSDTRNIQRRADRQTKALDRASDIKNFSFTRRGKEKSIAKPIIRAGDRLLGGLAGLTNVISDALGSLLAPKLTPEQIREGEIATDRREAEAELDTLRREREAEQNRDTGRGR